MKRIATTAKTHPGVLDTATSCSSTSATSSNPSAGVTSSPRNSTPTILPLCFCCDEARDQGGIVIWCHNGRGMEAPIAAALGKLDAFNLFDPFWMDPEYDLWYKLLNCGISLPASTGTDWFVCSNNRVYVNTKRRILLRKLDCRYEIGQYVYHQWSRPLI